NLGHRLNPSLRYNFSLFQMMSVMLIYGGQYVECVNLETVTKFPLDTQLPFYHYALELRIQIFDAPNNLHRQSPSMVLIIQSAIRKLHAYFYDTNQLLVQTVFRHNHNKNLR